MIIPRLVRGRDAQRMANSLTHVVEMRVIAYAGEVQSGARVSLIAPDRGHDAARLDAAAGGEFLDDRIRRRE